MTCNRCHGRGFYQRKEKDVTGVAPCGCEPDEKYKKLFDTYMRILEHTEKIEEE